MRISLRLLLSLLLLAIPAAAQPDARFDEGWRILHQQRQQSGPDFGRDDLVPEIPFAMERARAVAWATRSGFEIIHADMSTIELRQAKGAISMSVVLGLVAAKVRTIVLTVVNPDSSEKGPASAIRDFSRQLEERARRIEQITGGVIYYHLTSSGVGMRTSVRIIDGTRIVIEAGPGDPGSGPLPPDDSDLEIVEDQEPPRDFAYPATYPPDEFLPGIAIDMTREELDRWTVDGEWAMTRERSSYREYQLVQPALLGTLGVTFGKGKARAMTLKVVAAPESGVTIDQVLDPMVAALESRAHSKQIEGTRRTFLHRTSDGRIIRTVVEQTGDAGFTIESSIVKK